MDDSNLTIPAPDTESVASVDSVSVPTSPQSVVSGDSVSPNMATNCCCCPPLDVYPFPSPDVIDSLIIMIKINKIVICHP